MVEWLVRQKFSINVMQNSSQKRSKKDTVMSWTVCAQNSVSLCWKVSWFLFAGQRVSYPDGWRHHFPMSPTILLWQLLSSVAIFNQLTIGVSSGLNKWSSLHFGTVLFSRENYYHFLLCLCNTWQWIVIIVCKYLMICALHLHHRKKKNYTDFALSLYLCFIIRVYSVFYRFFYQFTFSNLLLNCCIVYTKNIFTKKWKINLILRLFQSINYLCLFQCEIV
jgi:hypothetical protein